MKGKKTKTLFRREASSEELTEEGTAADFTFMVIDGIQFLEDSEAEGLNSRWLLAGDHLQFLK